MDQLGTPLALLLSQADRRLARRLESLLAAHDSSIEQWRVLRGLSQDLEQCGLSMSDVASLGMLPPPSATKLVDRMVADNLVHRRTDVQDRRRVLVFLTRRGHALHRRLNLAVEQEQDWLAGLVSAQDLHALAKLLTRLITHLDADQIPSRPERVKPLETVLV